MLGIYNVKFNSIRVIILLTNELFSSLYKFDYVELLFPYGINMLNVKLKTLSSRDLRFLTKFIIRCTAFRKSFRK